jgi:hypothetical protein
MTPAEIIALRAHIDATPTYADWVANGNDQQIAEAVSALTAPVVGGVSRSRFAMWAGKTGVRSVIQDHANTVGSPLRSISLTLLDFLQGGVSDSLDFAEADNQMMLAVWIQMAAITQAQADDLLAMATTEKPVFGAVSNTDIAVAFGRTGMGG